MKFTFKAPKKIIPVRNQENVQRDFTEINQLLNTDVTFNATKDHDITITTCIVGPGNVGKTSMIHSLDKDNKNYEMTIFDNYVINYQLSDLKIQNIIYDTAGQDVYDDIRQVAISKSDIVACVFSFDDIASLDTNLKLIAKILQIYKDKQVKEKNSRNNQEISRKNVLKSQQSKNNALRASSKNSAPTTPASSNSGEYYAELPMIVLIGNKLDLYDETRSGSVTKKMASKLNKDAEKLIDLCNLNRFNETLDIYYTSAIQTPRRSRAIFLHMASNYLRACNGKKTKKFKDLSKLEIGRDDKIGF